MMDKKQDFWSWWCYRTWIKFGLCITGLVTIAILMYWNEWSTPVKVLAAIGALVPIHVVEEWVFPGGFHYQYNLFTHFSKQPDCYPMHRLSDAVTNLVATFLFISLALWYVLSGNEVPASLVLMTVGFCILEVVLHTYYGFMSWLRFRKAGKTTIYGPGSITAYFGFGVLGAILSYKLPDYTITTTDWQWGTVELIAIVCFILIQEQLQKNRNTRFKFPSAGYFERFIGK